MGNTNRNTNPLNTIYTAENIKKLLPIALTNTRIITHNNPNITPYQQQQHTTEWQDTCIDIQLAYKQLPKHYRACLTVRIIHGHTPASLAKKLGGRPAQWARLFPLKDAHIACTMIANILNPPSPKTEPGGKST